MQNTTLTESVKKNNEYVWASVFVNHINDRYAFDYIVEPQHDENSLIDMWAVSKSNTYPTLNLQLTYAIEVPFVAVIKNERIIDYSKQPTEDAIERKLQKFTLRNIPVHNIILIIQGYMDPEAAKDVFADPSLEKYKTYPFQGIYYVTPPMISGETNEYIQKGFVATLKNAFTEKDR